MVSNDMRPLIAHLFSDLRHLKARTEAPAKLDAKNKQEEQQSNKQEQKNIPPVRIASCSDEGECDSVILLSEIFSIEGKLELLRISVNFIWL